MKTVHQVITLTEEYGKLTKKEQKKLTYENIYSFFEKNPIYKNDYKDDIQFHGKHLRKVLLGWVQKKRNEESGEVMEKRDEAIEVIKKRDEVIEVIKKKDDVVSRKVKKARQPFDSSDDDSDLD
jgi:hypothetical protein